MKYLRRVLGITRLDKLWNVSVREPILNIIEHYQLGWFGHLTRMYIKKPVIQVRDARRHEKEPRGRPRNFWDKIIDKILAERGFKRNEAKTLALNKTA